MPLTTQWLSNQTSQVLNFLSDRGFRYYRSFGHFRRNDPEGHSYVSINVTTSQRGFYNLAFYLAVRNDLVESTIKQIAGSNTKLTHFDRSVWNFTMNIGPGFPLWDYPIRGSWSFQTEEDFQSHTGELVRFVTDLALPFLNENLSKDAIRRTLLQSPGHAQNLKPYQQIFAADILNHDLAALESDYAALVTRYKKYHRVLQDEFQDFYQRAIRQLNVPGT